jgi:drug/metabolite transporter (DMT)-like permease
MITLWPLALASTLFEQSNLAGFAFFAVSGIFSPGIVRLLYYQGMKKLGVSVNSSIYAAYPLYSALLAILLLSEVLSVWNALGIFAIIVAIVFVDLKISRQNGEGCARGRCLIFPILGGVTLGVSSIIRKYALDISNAPVFGVAVAYTFSLLPYAIILAKSVPTRKQLALKQSFRWFWVAGIGQAITWALAFYALTFEQVSIVSPILSVEPLFVAFFAYVYLKELEKVSLRLLGSIILTVFGVLLVTI